MLFCTPARADADDAA
jgi:hypothetical protein